jgi:hypothetical protein
MGMDTQEQRLTWLALFASTGTLICCALPIALVSLGLGATAAAISSRLPFLVSLPLHKNWVFGGSVLLLFLAAWVLYRPGRTCPADPKLALFGGVVVTYQKSEFQTDAQLSYRIKNESGGFDPGDEFRLDGSLQYRLWPQQLGGGVPKFLYGVLETSPFYRDESSRANTRSVSNILRYRQYAN